MPLAETLLIDFNAVFNVIDPLGHEIVIEFSDFARLLLASLQAGGQANQFSG